MKLQIFDHLFPTKAAISYFVQIHIKNCAGVFACSAQLLLSKTVIPFSPLFHTLATIVVLISCVFSAFLVWVEDSSYSWSFSFSRPKHKQSLEGLSIKDVVRLLQLSQGSSFCVTEGGRTQAPLNSENCLQLFIFFPPFPYLQLHFSRSFLGSKDRGK